MLAKLFGKKNDHPMKDIKRAQALLVDLPKNDAFKLLTELTAWIESVSLGEEFRLDDQFQVLCLLDETAQPYVRKLAYEYFTLPDMNSAHGKRLFQTQGNYSRHTVTAYLTLIGRYHNDDKGAASIKANLPLLVARAVRAMREQVKYAAAHYGPYDDEIWHHLVQLYSNAEQQQYLDVSLRLYPASISATTVKCEVGQLVALYGCGINSLSPQCMHLAERLIAQYGDTVETSTLLTGQVLFGIDLAHPSAPLRMSPDATLHASMRYISLTDMPVKLEALIKILKKNIVPQELNLGGTFAAEWVLDAAQHVLTHLVDPPVRQNKRLALSSVVDVVTGFENILGFYTGQSTGVSQSMPWVLENVSSSGFCAVLPNRRAEGLCIGNLLGIQTSGMQKPFVAVVRRMLHDAEGRLHVGVETLANLVSDVTLQLNASGGIEKDQSALWLHSDVEDGTARLLMHTDTFLMQRSLKTCFNGKNYLMIPAQLLESGADYDLASFRVIEQEEAEKQD